MVGTVSYAGPERRRARPSPWVIGGALAAVAGIVFVTVCPIGLRPHFADANAERFAAYVVAGALIARARGRAWVSAAAAVVVLALVLEAAQALVPGRHAMAPDAIVKALGGLCGVVAVESFFGLRRVVRRWSSAAGRRAEAVAVSSL